MSTLVYVCVAAPVGPERIMPARMSAVDLLTRFSAFGPIDDVLLMYRHAVIMFSSPDGAYRAITHDKVLFVNMCPVLARPYDLRPTTDAAYRRIVRHCQRVNYRLVTMHLALYDNNAFGTLDTPPDTLGVRESEELPVMDPAHLLPENLF